MRIEEQGTGIGVVKPESTVNVQRPRSKSKEEISINDLKTTPVEKQVQDAQKPVQDEEQLKEAVENANTLMDLSSYHMKFRIDEDSDRLQVSLIDNTTQKVIREIPSKQMLEISARIKEMLETINKMVGVFVDEIG